ALSRAIAGPGGATTITDTGSASFLRYTPNQLLSSSFGQAVSASYCSVFPISGTPPVTDPVQPLGLDAGTVEIGGSNGTKILIPLPGSKGYYNSNLGSNYLDPSAGPHTFNILGGTDVGLSFLEDVQSPAAITWANQASISTVSESQGISVNWSGAAPGGYV